MVTSYKAFSEKLLADPSHSAFAELRALQHQSQQFLDASQQLSHITMQRRATTPVGAALETISSPADASNFRLIVKITDTAVIGQRRGIKDLTTCAEVNDAIRRDLGVEEPLSRQREDDDLWASICSAHQLRSGDYQLETIYAEDVSLLAKGKQWPKLFGAAATVLQDTFGIIMASVQVETMDLRDLKARDKVKVTLGACNVALLGTTEVEDIAHINWLKPLPKGKSFSSVVVAFRSPKVANLALKRGLNWEGKTHSCDRYIPNSSIRQCYTCHGFGYIRAQCTSAKKCEKCARPGHDKEKCESKVSQCANCKEEGHNSWAASCPMQKKEHKKIAENLLKKKTLFPEQPQLQPQPTVAQVTPPSTNSPALSVTAIAAARKEEETPSRRSGPTTPQDRTLDPTIAALLNTINTMAQNQSTTKRNADSTDSGEFTTTLLSPEGNTEIRVPLPKRRRRQEALHPLPRTGRKPIKLIRNQA